MLNTKIFNLIKKRWYATAGYSEFFKIAFPLIVSIGGWALQTFMDRLFLSHYSSAAYAAAVPAGLLNCSIMDIFIGTVSYIDIFISQYNGKKEFKLIGPSVWQSIYLSLFSSFIILAISFFSENIFNFIGHSQDVIYEEIKYFRVLCYGAFPYLAGSAMAGFYSGRGKTKIILIVNLVSIIANTILDYLLIFGKFGFPELGIEGAAIATIISSIIMFAMFLLFITSKKNDALFDTRKAKLDFKFIKHLIKFGFPNGIHFFFDIFIFAFFTLAVGTLGKLELLATSITMNIYNLFYMPISGCGVTTAIMVGNYLGKNKTRIAQASVQTALHVTFVYVFLMVFLYIFVPDILIYPFSKDSEYLNTEQIRPTIIILLRFITVFAFFESASIIYSSAIKGAGDTSFVMKLLITLFIVTAIPMCLLVVFKAGLYACWSVLVIYGIMLMVFSYLRYKTNKWKHMRVIETNITDKYKIG
ncbi:MAG: MATE family efflux transporter [Endomicrobium sp.]|jgi:MATE family multidrug resistance protein|nr:MATE family efflux transporter [Endomicrobium sp.]